MTIEMLRLAMRSFASEPMAVNREELVKRLSSAMAAGAPRIAQAERLQDFLQAQDRINPNVLGTTAVVPVTGPLEFKLSLMGYWMGGTSYRALSRTIEQLANDPAIDRIVLDIDSPGGSVVGLRELCEQIYETRKIKNIVAVANPLAASAALRIGAAAKQFWGIASCYVGSLGSVTWLESWTEAYKMLGVDIRVYSDPDAKTETWPEKPISEDAEAHAKEVVAKATAEFVEDMAKYCAVSVKDVRDKFGGGRMIFGTEAAAAGLLNGIKSLDQVLKSAAKGSGGMRQDDSVRRR